jgi:3-hydroxyisobutyrate dehydrogenase-like beta-hydroxyacid dehydrogenase
MVRNGERVIGIIGLGLIGSALARRLLAAGYTVRGYDIDAGRCASLDEAGGEPVHSPREIAAGCRTILVAVLDTGQVEAVLEGPEGIGEAASGCNVICTSTCDPERIVALAGRLARRGVGFLEVPLSGNSDQVALGNGVGLIGGEPRILEALQPVLEIICPRRYHLGPVGSGGRAKLAVNLVGGLNRAVLAEGLAFADSMGLELEAFLEVLKASAAYSRTMDNRGMKMVREDFTPHARVAQSRKDFALMSAAAARAGQPLPLAAVYIDLIEGCLAQGEGDLDNSAIIREIRRRRRH